MPCRSHSDLLCQQHRVVLKVTCNPPQVESSGARSPMQLPALQHRYVFSLHRHLSTTVVCVHLSNHRKPVDSAVREAAWGWETGSLCREHAQGADGWCKSKGQASLLALGHAGAQRRRWLHTPQRAAGSPTGCSQGGSSLLAGKLLLAVALIV